MLGLGTSKPLTIGAFNAATYVAGSKDIAGLFTDLRNASLEPTQFLLYKPAGKSSQKLSLNNFQLVDIKAKMEDHPNTHILGIVSQGTNNNIFYVSSTSSAGATSNGSEDLALVQNHSGAHLITASIDQHDSTMRILDSRRQSLGALGLKPRSGREDPRILKLFAQ